MKVGNVNPNNPHQSGDVYSTEGLSRTLTCTDSNHPHLICDDYKINKVGNVSKQGHHNGTVYHPQGISRTLLARDYKDPVKIIDKKLKKDFRVRRLTPKECERLQGFPDDWTRYGKNGEEISDTQRYKCCGNAVTTNVITAIINEMFDDTNDTKS
jgi:DNA (cytosine-5)-methyltransferase 1